MPRQVLGKRPRSGSFHSPSSPLCSPTPAPKTRRAATSTTREPPSPDPTPNPKRAKICSIEIGDDGVSNKENIPPDSSFSIFTAPNTSSDNLGVSDATAAANAMTPRSIRASRRASTESTRLAFTPRRRVSSRPQSNLSSNHMSTSASVSRPAVQSPSTTDTPSRTIARLSLTTPPSTPITMPFPPSPDIENGTKISTSLHAQARALLRPQGYQATPILGREKERTHILDFLTPFIADESCLTEATSLYISGAPGTGKTALVNEILTSITSSSSSRQDNVMNSDNTPVRVMYINCMALGAKDGVMGIWERCIEELGPMKETKRVAAAKIDWSQRFGQLLRAQKCVLVLDEVDHLVASNSASTSVSQIFAIASHRQTRASLRIIGISNTHTLTNAKYTLDTQTLHFEPYTATQMKAVLSSRLVALANDCQAAAKLFLAPTLTLLTMKIASQTGDIRTLFSVARRALDLAVAGSTTPSAITVTPAHVLAALKASNTSIGTSRGTSGTETVMRVRNLGLQARFALVALLLATQRITSGLSITGLNSNTSSGKLKENSHPSTSSSAPDAVPSIDMTALYGFYATILRRGADMAFREVGRTEFADLVGLLEGSGLVCLAQGRGFGSKTKGAGKCKGMQVVCIASGVRKEELVRGLVGPAANGCAEGADVDVREEEVKHVWEREVAKMGREIKAKFGTANAKKADFEGAEED